jgi:hypothetical protein
MWLDIGEPLRDEWPEEVKLGRERGGANTGAASRAAGFSCTGELSKISESEREDDVAGLLEKLPLPNRNGGSWLSRAGRWGRVPVLKPLALASEGRRSPGFRLS